LISSLVDNVAALFYRKYLTTEMLCGYKSVIPQMSEKSWTF